jgi:hypothetical protein
LLPACTSPSQRIPVLRYRETSQTGDAQYFNCSNVDSERQDVSVKYTLVYAQQGAWNTKQVVPIENMAGPKFAGSEQPDTALAKFAKRASQLR